jgi:hypothetical protein
MAAVLQLAGLARCPVHRKHFFVRGGGADALAAFAVVDNVHRLPLPPRMAAVWKFHLGARARRPNNRPCTSLSSFRWAAEPKLTEQATPRPAHDSDSSVGWCGCRGRVCAELTAVTCRRRASQSDAAAHLRAGAASWAPDVRARRRLGWRCVRAACAQPPGQPDRRLPRFTGAADPVCLGAGTNQGPACTCRLHTHSPTHPSVCSQRWPPRTVALCPPSKLSAHSTCCWRRAGTKH